MGTENLKAREYCETPVEQRLTIYDTDEYGEFERCIERVVSFDEDLCWP